VVQQSIEGHEAFGIAMGGARKIVMGFILYVVEEASSKQRGIAI
jgi:hypothetical protein